MDIPEENPFRLPAPSAGPAAPAAAADRNAGGAGATATASSATATAATAGKAKKAKLPVAAASKTSRRQEGPAVSASAPPSSSSSSSFAAAEYGGAESADAFRVPAAAAADGDDDYARGGAAAGAPASQQPQGPTRPRGKLARCCRSCVRGSVKGVASSPALSSALFFLVAVACLGLFSLSCSLLGPASPFTQRNVNWRVPLSFFATIFASTAVGNSQLRQLRSLLLMSLGMAVSGLLFFFVLIIDAPQVDVRNRECGKLPKAVAAASEGCKTSHYTAVVLLDLALIFLLLWAGIVAWFHRKTLQGLAIFFAGAAGVSRGQGAASGIGGAGGEGSGDVEAANVFR
jgi:hypothetical protein